jgi:hypothetical protein
MTTEFDFSRFVKFLDEENEKKSNKTLDEDQSLNRIRDAKRRDMKYTKVIWGQNDKK